MDLSLLETLKEKVQTEKEFKNIWEYFLDHFGEDPAFLDQGAPIKSEFLESVLDRVAKEMFADEELKDMILVRLPEHRFIHGAGKLIRHLINVIYFEDIETGVACVIKPFTKMTHLARFTGEKLERSWEPSVN